MLISRRKEGETLLLGDDIEIRIVSVRGKKVILGVVAPRHIKVAAEKLSTEALANTLSALDAAKIDRILRQPTSEFEKPISLLKSVSQNAGNDR